MIVSLIVAASTNNKIGKENQLLWNLPNDTKYFKNTTWGMPIIMGRKTFESFGSGPLPGRFNFVITHQTGWDPHHDKVRVMSNLEEAIAAARETDCKETFVIGGGQVYADAMPIADRIYMTRVHVVLDSDTSFPVIDDKYWTLQSERNFPSDEKHAYAYSFQVWERKK